MSRINKIKLEKNLYNLENLPLSWVYTAWQTEQGHILRFVLSWLVSGWQAKCFLRLPSLT